MTKKSPADYPTISFRPGESLLAALETRTGDGPAHGTAKRDLERYYDLLARDVRRLTLSEAEIMLLLDVSNGTLWEPTSIPLLYAEVENALQDGVEQKWGVDGLALVGKLRALSLGQTYALVDGLERAWKALGEHDGDLKAAAVAAGLVRA